MMIACCIASCGRASTQSCLNVANGSVRFDYDKASEMLNDHLQHMEEFKPWSDEQIFATNEFKSRSLILLENADHWGRPVLYIRSEYVNPAWRTPDDCEQVFSYYLREMAKKSKDADHEACVIVFNLSGWGSRNVDNATLKMQIQVLQSNYPEMLGQCFIVNYPWCVASPRTVTLTGLCARAQVCVASVESGTNLVGSGDGRQGSFRRRYQRSAEVRTKVNIARQLRRHCA
jgi:hypothetical protein